MRFIVYSVLILMALASTTFGTILQKGDIVHIESWPDIRYTRFVKVDNNGILRIPYYNGKIQAEGKSVEEIDKIVKSKFRYKFPTIKFVVTFSGNASIKTSVVGAVFYPGEYIFPTGSRISTIIKQVDMKNVQDNDKYQYISEYNGQVFSNNVLSSFATEENTGTYLSKNANVPSTQEKTSPNQYPKYNEPATEKSFLYESVSYRNVELIRKGEKTIVDVMKYFHDGDLNNNPVIQEGDVVVFRYIKKNVSIKGAVNFPNTYEMKDGETLQDMVDFAGGHLPSAYTDGVQVSNPEEGTLLTVALDSLSSIKVKNHDHIYFSFNKKERNVREVVLDGAVPRPGIYPLADSTTLSEVIENAGGLSPSADLFGIRITRHSDVNVGPFTDVINAGVSRIRISATDTSAGDLKIYLNDGDEVLIPEKSNVVHVAGYVGKPGSFEWIEGKGADYYLELAGGENRFSYNDLIRVVKANTGEIKMIEQVSDIGVGDLIYLPPYVAPSSRPGFLTFKEVVVVMGTMAALILNSFLIYQNASK